MQNPLFVYTYDQKGPLTALLAVYMCSSSYIPMTTCTLYLAHTADEAWY